MSIPVIILLFGLVLGIMVLLHELGHFIMAKLCGVRVETFSLGFGPRLFGVVFRGTDYRVSALPIGGYVKMAGSDENPAERRLDESIDLHGSDHPHDPAEFNARPRWQRILIALAGPFANFLLSFFLLAFLAKFHHEVEEYLDGVAVVDYVPVTSDAAKLGIQSGDTITQFWKDHNPNWQLIFEDAELNNNHDVPVSWLNDGATHSGLIHVHREGTADPSVADLVDVGLIPRMSDGVGVEIVSPGDPADHAGIRPGDQIKHIDNLPVHSVLTLLSYLKDRNGAPAVVSGTRNGQPIQFHVLPEKLDSGAGDVQYRIGFKPQEPPSRIVQLPLGESIRESIKDNKQDSKLIGRVLSGMFQRRVSVRQLSGPVGIAQEIGVAAQYGGVWGVIRLMSSISLNLGIFNLLPIPLLDGGMIVFLLIESIMRRDLNQQIKERVYQAAFVCLILFAAFVIFNDITKLHMAHP